MHRRQYEDSVAIRIYSQLSDAIVKEVSSGIYRVEKYNYDNSLVGTFVSEHVILDDLNSLNKVTVFGLNITYSNFQADKDGISTFYNEEF